MGRRGAGLGAEAAGRSGAGSCRHARPSPPPGGHPAAGCAPGRAGHRSGPRGAAAPAAARTATARPGAAAPPPTGVPPRGPGPRHGHAPPGPGRGRCRRSCRRWSRPRAAAAGRCVAPARAHRCGRAAAARPGSRWRTGGCVTSGWWRCGGPAGRRPPAPGCRCRCWPPARPTDWRAAASAPAPRRRKRHRPRRRRSPSPGRHRPADAAAPAPARPRRPNCAQQALGWPPGARCSWRAGPAVPPRTRPSVRPGPAAENRGTARR